MTTRCNKRLRPYPWIALFLASLLTACNSSTSTGSGQVQINAGFGGQGESGGQGASSSQGGSIAVSVRQRGEY